MAVTDKLKIIGAALLLCAMPLGAAQVTKDIEYSKPEGVSLTLDASVPEGGTGPYPAVIIVHGGGFTQGNKEMFVTPLFKPLTDARFVWFSINYRLAPQYQLPSGVADVANAIRWVRAHAAEYKVDRKRIALMGESAGAFLVDYVAVTAPKDARVAAVVSFYGPHDLLFQVRQKKTISPGLAGFTGVKSLDEEGEGKLKAMSPYYLLHRREPPFLLIHGTEDEQVPYEQSVRFRKALEDHGTRCDLFTVEGAKHGVGPWESHPDEQQYKAKMVEWLRATLR